MRKSLLLAGLVAFSFSAFAQDEPEPKWWEHNYPETGFTAQEIPGNVLLDNCQTWTYGVTDYQIMLWSENSSAPTKYNPAQYFVEKNHAGDYMLFKVENKEASYFIINLSTGTKENDTACQLTLFEGDNADTPELWSMHLGIPNNGEWNSIGKAAHPYAPVTTVIPAGVHLFKLEFLYEGEKDTNPNCFNIYDINFEAAAEEPTVHSIFSSVKEFVNGEEVDSDECGTLTISPKSDEYLKGREVTFSAAAKTGYKYLYMVIDGEKYTDKSVKVTVNDDIDVYAVFQEISLWSNVPGTLDLDAIQDIIQAGKGNNVTTGQISVYNEETSDYVTCTKTYLTEIRNTGSCVFWLNVTETGAYPIKFFAATKQATEGDAASGGSGSTTWEFTNKDNSEEVITVGPIASEITGGYAKFYPVQSATPVNLTAGKWILKISFTGGGNPASGTKESCSLYDIRIGDIPPADGVATVEAVKASVKAYNVFGLEVAPDAEGLVIVNGKKVFNVR